MSTGRDTREPTPLPLRFTLDLDYARSGRNANFESRNGKNLFRKIADDLDASIHIESIQISEEAIYILAECMEL